MPRPFVTQTEVNALLHRAGLPLSEKPTQPPPPFGSEGFALYEDFIDPRGYLRAPLTVASSLLDHPMY